MAIAQHTGPIIHVHIRTEKTKPGGWLTWEKWRVLLKCTLSTETLMERDCQILRSELVGYQLLHHLLHCCTVYMCTYMYTFNKVQIVGLGVENVIAK